MPVLQVYNRWYNRFMVRTVNQLVGQKMLWGFAGMGHHNGTGKDRFDFIPLNSLMGFKV